MTVTVSNIVEVGKGGGVKREFAAAGRKGRRKDNFGVCTLGGVLRHIRDRETAS